MAAENLAWGAPRIHGELLKLGFNVSEPTVSRWRQRMPTSPDLGKRWLILLRNHREGIASDGLLYCPDAYLWGSERIGHEVRIGPP